MSGTIQSGLRQAKHFNLLSYNSLGADYVINPQEIEIEAEVKRITGQDGANVTIDAVCTPQTFEQAVQLTTSAGRVMCLGFTNEFSKIAQFWITAKELDVKGSRHQTFKFAEVVDLFNNNKLHPEKLISDVFNISDYEKAFRTAETPSDSTCKVVIKF